MDRDFNKVIDMGAKPVTVAAREYGQNGQHERLFFDDIVIREAGNMYIYISNEGEELVDVFFDDLKVRSEEHTSELQSLMRISYAVFCLEKKNTKHQQKD